MEYERGVRLKLFLAAGVRFSLKRLPQLMRSLAAAADPQTSKLSYKKPIVQRNNQREKVTLVTKSFDPLHGLSGVRFPPRHGEPNLMIWEPKLRSLTRTLPAQ